VPSGGVFVDDKLNALFWTDHCALPGLPFPGGLMPYLALAPRETFGDPKTWLFFAGRVAGQWVKHQEWESGTNANGSWKPPASVETTMTTPSTRPRANAASESIL
jgi:hypothetical protein